jgi:cysteine desulfurase / selenocysteine lyase
MQNAIYLDYAATSAIRPPEVVEAVTRFLTDVGATPGRSGHARAIEAGRVALRCRSRVAELLGFEGDPGRIVFQLNATHALNVALAGLLTRGDRVVRTAYDHNAVRRPVSALATAGIGCEVLSVTQDGSIDMAEAEARLGGTPPVRLLVLPHASNVTGVVLPVRELVDRAHAVGALVLLDAAQTVGHLPIDVESLGIDVLVFTGHKGMLGPQGIGGLWIRPGVDIRPMLSGGTGGDSLPLEMPRVYPDRLEAGTQNGPAMAGLTAGVDWTLSRGVDRIRANEASLKRRLLDGLATVPHVRICSPAVDDVGIVSLLHERLEPSALAAALERQRGVQGRAGLHCAPEAHRTMGTLRSGAFRLSIGWATTAAEIDATVEGLRELP